MGYIRRHALFLIVVRPDYVDTCVELIGELDWIADGLKRWRSAA